jgi:hypothetical protein
LSIAGPGARMNDFWPPRRYAVALVERALVDRSRFEPVLLAHLAVVAVHREDVAVSRLPDGILRSAMRRAVFGGAKGSETPNRMPSRR